MCGFFPPVGHCQCIVIVIASVSVFRIYINKCDAWNIDKTRPKRRTHDTKSRGDGDVRGD